MTVLCCQRQQGRSRRGVVVGGGLASLATGSKRGLATHLPLFSRVDGIVPQVWHDVLHPSCEEDEGGRGWGRGRGLVVGLCTAKPQAPHVPPFRRPTAVEAER